MEEFCVKKNILSCLLIVAMLLSLAPIALAEGEALTYEPTGESYTRDENGFPQLGGKTITIWIPINPMFQDVITNYTELDIMQYLNEMLDVDLQFVHPPIGQEKEHFALMMAGDELPDLIFKAGIDSYYPGGFIKAFDDGVLFDYTALVNEQNTPNFIEKVLGDPYYAKGAYDDYGRIVRLGSGVSGSEESCATMFGIMVRADMLADAGIETPVTIDDWYNAMVTLKGSGIEYPLILDKANYWQTRNAFSAAYGLSANDFCIMPDGRVAYAPYEDSFKDYLATMHKWYAEGLINPDFMNQDKEQTWSMIADDLGAFTVSHLWDYNHSYHTPVETQQPEKSMMALDFPVLQAGDTIRNMVTNRTLHNHKYITVDSENPLACALLLDAFYIDEIEFKMSYGTEGYGYSINEHGYPMPTTITPGIDRKVLEGYGVYEFETATDDVLDYITTSKYHYGIQPDCINIMIKNGYEGIYPSFVTHTSEEATQLAKYMTDINTYREEMILKFVTGKESLDNFDAYQQRLRDMHMDEVLQIYQDSYDRYLQRGE